MPFDDFTTQIQIDEKGGQPGGDWIDDFEDTDSDEFIDD
jgi:hypothetical protein